jgi:hypothetical protein
MEARRIKSGFLNVKVQIFLGFQQIPHFNRVVTCKENQAPMRSER